MKIKPGAETLWQSWVDANQDFYGKGTMDYARSWAELMEVEIAGGKGLCEAVKDTRFKATPEGITGYMFGMACQMLIQAWEHGDQLEKWRDENLTH